VVQFRLKGEYGVDSTLEPLGFTMARWVEGSWPAVAAAGRMFNTQVGAWLVWCVQCCPGRPAPSGARVGYWTMMLTRTLS
jgi:hypothetical protein